MHPVMMFWQNDLPQRPAMTADYAAMICHAWDQVLKDALPLQEERYE